MPPERVVELTEDIKERRPEIPWPKSQQGSATFFVMRMITSRQMCFGFRRSPNPEAAGVEFIDENGGGPGVRLRKSGKEKPRK